MTLLSEGIYMLGQGEESTDFSTPDGTVIDPTVIVIYIDKMKMSKYRKTQCVNPAHVDCEENKTKILPKCPIVFDGTAEEFAKCIPSLIRFIDNKE